MEERGANKNEVEEAIKKGERIPAKRGRRAYRRNFQYNKEWGGKLYSMKQVMPVVVEENETIVVVTVYTFYF